MNKCNLIGAYIPAFGKIVSQMQHDLFHIYTVDEHILNVLRNLRRFAKDELKHEFPDCYDLFKNYNIKSIDELKKKVDNGEIEVSDVIKKGVKYVIRTDIMYRPPPEPIQTSIYKDIVIHE
mgnify:CR=1 FL=1